LANQDTAIWIIDGDHSIRRSLKRLLKSTGLEVETCASAEEFRSRQDPRSRCCCLVLDIESPDTENLKLQQTLNESLLADSPPVIFMTAQDDPTVERQALQNGAIAVLRKPFDADTLLEAVAAGLARTRNQVRP
jgi:FixJ family two-component response regulator